MYRFDRGWYKRNLDVRILSIWYWEIVTLTDPAPPLRSQMPFCTASFSSASFVCCCANGPQVFDKHGWNRMEKSENITKRKQDVSERKENLGKRNRVHGTPLRNVWTTFESISWKPKKCNQENVLQSLDWRTTTTKTREVTVKLPGKLQEQKIHCVCSLTTDGLYHLLARHHAVPVSVELREEVGRLWLGPTQAIEVSNYHLANSRGLVLGCIEAEFCKELLHTR